MTMPAKTTPKPAPVTVTFQVSPKAAAFFETLGAKDARTNKPVSAGAVAQQLFKGFLIQNGLLDYLERVD